MAENFHYDVFLCHSSEDKEVVRDVAERLKRDRLQVWFDEWELKPGDSIPAKIEEGLEHSRVLVLCMSKNAFGSDWAGLESQTFRYRDPQNKNRRFIPLRLDNTPIKGSLGQFLYINWLPQDRETEYAKLREACGPPVKAIERQLEGNDKQVSEKEFQLNNKDGKVEAYEFSRDQKHAFTAARDKTVRLWHIETGRCLRVFKGHTMEVWSLAWSADQRFVLSGDNEGKLRLWDVRTGLCLRMFSGHINAVWSVAWCTNRNWIVSGALDYTVRVWDVNTGRCQNVFNGHFGCINSVACSTDENRILSGSDDGTVRLWDIKTGECLRVFRGHTREVWSVAWRADQHKAISGSFDNTVRVWNVNTGRCLRVLEGHTGRVRSVAWSTNQPYVLSGSDDRTVRVWNVESGRCLRILKGHTAAVFTVAWGVDCYRAFSGDSRGNIRAWDLSELVIEDQTPETYTDNTSILPPVLDEVQYTNAKVLLVGESGVGKTGLSKRLALNIWKPSDSTVGAWATHWPLSVVTDDGIEREIWLWDFGGQADQRLIHQLYMDETALAVLVFDGQKEDLFETLGQWDRDLTRAATKDFIKILVAGRIDTGGLRLSKNQINVFAEERGYSSFIETSAKIGTGCEELKQAILDGIPWENIPWLTSPRLFKRLKEEIIRLKDEGHVLMRFNELREYLRLRMANKTERFKDDELKAVISLLAGPGAVWELKFGSWVLLQPERINAYAQAVIQDSTRR